MDVLVRRVTRWVRIIGIAAAVVLAVSGCGDDSDGTPDADVGGDSGDTPTDTPTDTPVDTPADTTGLPAWLADFPIEVVMLGETSLFDYYTDTWVPSMMRAFTQVWFRADGDFGSYEPLTATTLLQMPLSGGGEYGYGVEGAATSYDFVSARQDVSVTWDDMAGFGYIPFGLDTTTDVGSFDDTDTLAFSAVLGASNATANVPAPPALDLDTILGPPAGLATELSLEDGTFDLVIVWVLLQDSTNNAVAALHRVLWPSDMTLAGGRRVAPLVDSESLAAAAGRGLTPYDSSGPMSRTSFTLTIIRQELVEGIGPGGRAEYVRAARQLYCIRNLSCL